MLQNNNDSSTGGPLQPIPTGPAPLEGRELDKFIARWVLGITGMDPGTVRPRWQPEPANLPPAGQVWCAVGIVSRSADTYPFIGHEGDGADGQGIDRMQRHEDLEVLASFFDLGVNGQADFYCALLRDGAQISQNSEILTDNGFAFVSSGDATALPSLLKERWSYRVDLPITLRRNVVRVYPVRSIVTPDFTIIADPPVPPHVQVSATLVEQTNARDGMNTT